MDRETKRKRGGEEEAEGVTGAPTSPPPCPEDECRDLWTIRDRCHALEKEVAELRGLLSTANQTLQISNIQLAERVVAIEKTLGQ